MDFDEEFDEEFDEDLDDDFDEELEMDDSEIMKSKSPSDTGKKIALYFMSTIGPGEKKHKLVVYTGNIIENIKETVGNLFALNPLDFHLSHGGITLDERNPLSEYNVKDGDDILLIPASVAGMNF